MRVPLFLLTLMAAAAAFAAGTGPTHPNKAREHPLDAREPRQEVIEHGDQAAPATDPGVASRRPSHRAERAAPDAATRT